MLIFFLKPQPVSKAGIRKQAIAAPKASPDVVTSKSEQPERVSDPSQTRAFVETLLQEALEKDISKRKELENKRRIKRNQQILLINNMLEDD